MAVIANAVKQSLSLRAKAFKLNYINPTDCFTTFAMTEFDVFLMIRNDSYFKHSSWGFFGTLLPSE
jgi:hypothetical protein